MKLILLSIVSEATIPEDEPDYEALGIEPKPIVLDYDDLVCDDMHIMVHAICAFKEMKDDMGNILTNIYMSSGDIFTAKVTEDELLKVLEEA